MLFGDVWERKGLSKRDRSLITCAALIALNRTEQQVGHFQRALNNGVTKEELLEVITHLAFYGGWPVAMSAANVAKKVFEGGDKQVKLCYFNDYRLGVVKGDQVVDVTDAVKDIPHLDARDLIIGLIKRWDDYKAKVEKAAADGKGVPLSGVRLRPPVPKPGNIVCMAVNYMEDGTLQGEAARSTPSTRRRTRSSATATPWCCPTCRRAIFEGEAELALVIGKRATRVPAADAMKLHLRLHLLHRRLGARPAAAGQRLLPDEVARHLRADRAVDRHRRRDRRSAEPATSRSPTTAQVMQKFNTNDMAHKIPRCIEWVSSIHTLEPGDILATGTNHRGLNSVHGRRQDRAHGREGRHAASST